MLGVPACGKQSDKFMPDSEPSKDYIAGPRLENLEGREGERKTENLNIFFLNLPWKTCFNQNCKQIDLYKDP